MDAPCKIQGSIHVFRLIIDNVSRILGTYQMCTGLSFLFAFLRPDVDYLVSVLMPFLNRMYEGFLELVSR